MNTKIVQGNLYIVSGPSGCGKTSLVNAVVNATPNAAISVSHITRPRRSEEIHGKHYFFVDEATFLSMINQNAFLEYAKVFGFYYGTSQEWVTKTREAGQDVILEIDWQGAAQVRQQYPDAISLFILPPSASALANRLHQRRQDSPEVIAKRLKGAKEDLSHYLEFDYLIVNDDFDQAVQGIQSIIKAQNLTLSKQAQQISSLLIELLA